MPGGPGLRGLLGSIGSASRLDPRARFAAQVQAALRSRSGARYTYAPGDFALRRSGTDHVVFLANIFATCQNLPRHLKRQQIAGFVTSLAEADQPLPTTFDQARPALMPVVRAMADWDAVQRHGGQQGKAIAMSPPGIRIGEELGVWLALDRLNSVSHLKASTLDSWKVDFATAYAVAEENLRARTARPFERRDDGVYASSWHDAYDSSRLLLPDLLRALPLDGPPVAMVPNRDWLLVADSARPAAWERLGALAAEIFSLPRPLSAAVLQPGPQGWETVALDPARPEHHALLALQRRALAGRYSEQKRLLDEARQSTGNGVFAGSVFEVDDPAAGAYTLAVWGNGMHALLPHVDRIGFKDSPDAPVQQVPWDEAVRLAGALMQPMGWFPERWLVEVYPEPAIIAQMARA
jgi:hypothetical protein